MMVDFCFFICYNLQNNIKTGGYVMLFHVTKKSCVKSKKINSVRCCKFNQLLSVANKKFKNDNEDIVVVCLDSSKLAPPYTYNQPSTDTYDFIPSDSIVDIIDFPKDLNGDFFISNDLANFEHFEKSCGAIIIHKFQDRYKVLLINFISGKNSFWGFPKGHMENGETEFETVHREIKEEVGLEVDLIKDFREFTYFSMKPGSTLEAVYYGALTESTETISQEGEVEKTMWASFEEAFKYLSFDCDRAIFSKFTNFIEEKFFTR